MSWRTSERRSQVIVNDDVVNCQITQADNCIGRIDRPDGVYASHIDESQRLVFLLSVEGSSQNLINSTQIPSSFLDELNVRASLLRFPVDDDDDVFEIEGEGLTIRVVPEPDTAWMLLLLALALHAVGHRRRF
ncbi:MAG: hypothetical protein KDA87_19915 [Planctomycetales bacterium]|nr:hypothetical protein [Planctomycetales bacterium]